MRIGLGGRLSVAFSCVLMAAVARAASLDAASANDALRDMAARIDAAARNTLDARAAGRTPAAALGDAVQRARRELDALARAAAKAGFAGDATFARKQRQVGLVLANLERLQRAARDAALPELVAATDPRRTMHAVPGAAGATCAAALSIAPGDAIEATLSAAGTPGDALWVRIAPRGARYVRLDTKPTPLDTDITLFGRDCPASDADAVAHDDDAYGLASALTVDTQRFGGVRYARVRNLGRAGRAIARFDTTGAFVGRTSDERDGSPLASSVQTVTPDGYFGNGTYSDETTGLYLLSADPGSYYVYASGPNWVYSYIPELYPDAPCGGPYYYGLDSCDVASATLLTLQDGQQIAGIDFALNIGARVAGTVRDAASGAPVPDASVVAFDANGATLTYGVGTDAAGRYMISGLLTGTIRVEATATGYGNQLWDHIACGGYLEGTCDPLTGTPLAVVRNELTTGIDFDLTMESHVRAEVSARSGVLTQGWALTLYDASGNYFGEYFTYSGTTLDTGPLPPGGYRAYASATGFFGQLWNGIDCPAGCEALLAQGALVTVTPNGEADLSFSLLALPSVSGTITDAATHAPLQNINVTLVPVASGGASAYATTDAAGHYAIAYAAAGSYYVFANNPAYRSTVYPAAVCAGNGFDTCDLGAATPVTTAYGGPDLTGIDIAMPANGSISGHLALRLPDGMGLAPIVPQYENISLFDAGGTFAGAAFVATDGSYVVSGVPAGTYHAIASGDAFDQAYGGVDCTAACDPSAGTPIPVAQGQNVTGIDFDPMPYNYVFGRVTNAAGAGIGGVAVDLWRSVDLAHCDVATTNAGGYYAVSDVQGWCQDTHKLSTDAPAAYVDQVYDGIPCPDGPAWLGLCSLDAGDNVAFPSTPSFTIANFSLDERDPIFANGFD